MLLLLWGSSIRLLLNLLSLLRLLALIRDILLGRRRLYSTELLLVGALNVIIVNLLSAKIATHIDRPLVIVQRIKFACCCRLALVVIDRVSPAPYINHF